MGYLIFKKSEDLIFKNIYFKLSPLDMLITKKNPPKMGFLFHFFCFFFFLAALGPRCGTRASSSCCVPGLCPLHRKVDFLTTRPLGKSPFFSASI